MVHFVAEGGAVVASVDEVPRQICTYLHIQLPVYPLFYSQDYKFGINSAPYVSNRKFQNTMYHLQITEGGYRESKSKD